MNICDYGCYHHFYVVDQPPSEGWKPYVVKGRGEREVRIVCELQYTYVIDLWRNITEW